MAVHLRSAIELLILFVVCQVSSAVLPSYIGNRLIGIVERTDLIKHYFSLGLQYSEILAFLLSSWNSTELASAQTNFET